MRKQLITALLGILCTAVLFSCSDNTEHKNSEEKAAEMTRELIQEMESQTDTLANDLEVQSADSAETAK